MSNREKIQNVVESLIVLLAVWFAVKAISFFCYG